MFAVTVTVRDRETGYTMDYNYECHDAERVIDIVQGTLRNISDSRFYIAGVVTA